MRHLIGSRITRIYEVATGKCVFAYVPPPADKSVRHASYSLWHSIDSIRYLHNQSINIATHTLGAVAFLFFFYSFYIIDFVRRPEASLKDLVPILIYCSGVVLCFLSSAT